LIFALGNCGGAQTSELDRLEPLTQQEREFGDRISLLIQAASPLVMDRPSLEYMGSVLERLTLPIRSEGMYNRVFIVQTYDIQAQSVSNGDIFVSQGLLWMADDEASLACVLAHELGHIYHHHTREGLQYNVEVTRRLKQVSSQNYQSVNNDLLKTIFSTLDNGKSRDQEREADRFALELMERSVYDVTACERVMGALLDYEFEYTANNGGTGPERTKIFDTHPHLLERLEDIHRFLQSRGHKAPVGERFAERYRQMFPRPASNDQS